METVQDGLYISVTYTGKFDNGEVFDTNTGRQPLEVKMGAGQVVAGFENALSGMALNEKKVVTVEPEDAYGIRDENLTRDFSRQDVPEGMDPQKGQTIALTTPDGQQIPARITQVDEEKVTVDMNHPLAGETLTFEIEVVAINKEATQKTAGCGSGCDCDCDSGCG